MDGYRPMTDKPMNKAPQTSPFFLPIALICALLVSQIGLDLSVPAIPQLADDLRTSVAAVQGTLVLYMLGYALAMVFAGLLSDRFSPRSVQIWAFVLASAAALMSAFSSNFLMFSVARFLQALGGGAGIVTTRLIIKEAYPEHSRMKILTALASVLAVTPCVMPLLGGSLLPYLGWRNLFMLDAFFSLGALGLFAGATRGIEAPSFSPKTPLGAPRIFAIYRQNFANTKFRFYTVAISLIWMSYFSFISCSSYPLQIGLDLSPLVYGAVLAASAFGYMLGSTGARLMSKRRESDEILRLGCRGGCLGGALFLLMTTIQPNSLISVVIPMFLILVAAGMIVPATQAGLLRTATQNPGVSSGQFFFCQMSAGALYAATGNISSKMTVPGLGLLVALPTFALLMIFIIDSRWKRAKEVATVV